MMHSSSGADRIGLGLTWAHGRLKSWMFVLLAALAGSMWINAGSDLINVLQDDYFYYHVIARNYLNGLGTSFFPGVPTNGYQPLWQFVVVASLAVSDALGLDALRMSHLLSVLVGYAAVGVICARLAHAPKGGLMLVLPPLAAAAFYFANMGMEAVAIMLAYALYARRMLRPDDDWIVPALLLFACFLSRIDSLVYIGPVTVYVYRHHRRTLARMLLCFFALAALYAGINHALYGASVPVSGLAKNATTLRLHAVTFETLVGNHSNQLLIAMTVLASLGMHFFRPSMWRLQLLSGLCVLGFYVLHAFRSDYGVWGWYLYPFALHLVTIAVFAPRHRAVDAQPSARRRRLLVGGAQALGMAGLAVMLGWHLLQNVIQPRESTLVQAARYVAEVASQRGAKVIAMGDRAGVVAYLAPTALVQLEGLVMDKAYLEAMSGGGRQPLGEILRRYNVDLYVATTPLPGSREGCHVVQEPAQATDKRTRQEICYPLAGAFKASDGPQTLIFNVKLPDDGQGLVTKSEGTVPAKGG